MKTVKQCEERLSLMAGQSIAHAEAITELIRAVIREEQLKAARAAHAAEVSRCRFGLTPNAGAGK